MRRLLLLTGILFSVPLSVFTERNSVALRQSTVGYWSFDSASRYFDTAFDVSGHGVHMVNHVVQNLVTNELGAAGGFLTPKQAYGRISASRMGGGFNFPEMSVSLWLHPNDLSLNDTPYRTQGLFCYASKAGEANAGYRLYLTASRHLVFDFADKDNPSIRHSYSTRDTVPLRWWSCVTAAYSSKLKKICFSINGSVADSFDCPYGYAPNTGDALVGGLADLPNDTTYYNGFLDEIYLADTFLTATRLRQDIGSVCPAIVPKIIGFQPSVIGQRQPRFFWHPAWNGDAVNLYRVVIGVDSVFTSIITDTVVPDTTFTSAVLLPYGDIFWKVARNAFGELFSGTGRFTVQKGLLPELIAPSDTVLTRTPTLVWSKASSFERYAVSVTALSETAPSVADTVGDTMFIIDKTLAPAKYYWKVCDAGSALQCSLTDSFVVYDPAVPCQVPNGFRTVAEALRCGNTVVVTRDITENIVITNAKVNIIGADTGVTITGKAIITGGTVLFDRINLSGVHGYSPGIASALVPEPCPSPAAGANGDTALIAVGSTISFRNGYIREGLGGAGQIARVCDGVTCVQCAAGKHGSDGIAIKARDKTVIDTVHALIGTLSLDSTSTIVMGIASVAPMRPCIEDEAAVAPVILPSGRIVFSQKIDFTVTVFNLLGREVVRHVVKGKGWTLPEINRGVYLITVQTAQRTFHRRCMVLRRAGLAY